MCSVADVAARGPTGSYSCHRVELFAQFTHAAAQATQAAKAAKAAAD